jgi:hypothetical protein
MQIFPIERQKIANNSKLKIKKKDSEQNLYIFFAEFSSFSILLAEYIFKLLILEL